MKNRFLSCVVFYILLMMVSIAHADPQEVISEIVFSKSLPVEEEFQTQNGDYWDYDLPIYNFRVLPDGRVVQAEDNILKIYMDGTLHGEINADFLSSKNTWSTLLDGGFYLFSNLKEKEYTARFYGYDGLFKREFSYVGKLEKVLSDGRLIIKDEYFKLFTPEGEILKTTRFEPLESHLIKTNNSRHQGKLQTIFKYEGSSSMVFSEQAYDDFRVGRHGVIIAINDEWIDMFDRCGKQLFSFELPKPIFEEEEESDELYESYREPGLLVAYGDPQVTAEGDVYIWKEEENQLQILRWDFSSFIRPAETVPPPSALYVAETPSGNVLSWQLSSQDPGCVDSYEVVKVREGGQQELIATLPAGSYKWRDPNIGNKDLKYRVRASSDEDDSDWSGVVQAIPIEQGK